MLLLFQTPHDSEQVSTFAGGDESALFHRFDGIATGGQRTHFFIVFQPPKNWIAAKRIGFKLVSVLDVRQKVLFDLSEFWQESSGFLLHHFFTSTRGRVSSLFPLAALQEIRIGSRRRNAATTGTTGYARAFHRAFDWQQRCRLR